jgi:hypothetical protein
MFLEISSMQSLYIYFIYNLARIQFDILQNWRYSRQILNFPAKFITPVTKSSRDVDHIMLRLPYYKTTMTS